MSKNTEELIRRRRPLNDEPEQIVARNHQSKLPLLPIIIVLFVVSLLFNVLYKDRSIIESLTDSILPEQAMPNKQNPNASPKVSNIHQLVSKGKLNDIEQKLLISDRETVNDVVNGMTPIMLAASDGNVEIIELLFTQGADPNKRGSMQRTALQYAVEKNHIDAAKYLLAYGADINAYDNGQLSPLIMAADRGYTELALFFIEKGADVDSQHAQGWTALIDAARNGDEKLVHALLDADADKTLSMKNGMRAIDYALQNKHKRVVDILAE